LIYGIYILNWDKLDLFISRWSVPGQTAGINGAGIYYILIAMPLYSLSELISKLVQIVSG
jgi:hypothetical protein